MKTVIKTPLSIVKDKFGDKAKLVAAVEKLAGEDLWVSRTNKDKGLAHVSNSKLVHLHEVFSTVKEKFGTREKLIAAVLEVEKRTKDEGYKTHLSAYPVPRLFDLYKSASKRASVATKEPKKDAPKKDAPKKVAAAKPTKAAAPKKA